MRQVNKIPGYKSIAEFERIHKLPEGTGKRHMQRGYCAWPRKTIIDGRAKHPLYKSWQSIISRCTVKGHTSFKNYGGRGITFNLDWYTDFWLFVKEIETLGPRPSPQHTLDRIDNDGNYVIENLRWACKSTQSANQRKQKNNTSGVVGVSYYQRDGVWEFKRKRKGKVFRKSFKTKEEAIKFKEQFDDNTLTDS